MVSMIGTSTGLKSIKTGVANTSLAMVPASNSPDNTRAVELICDRGTMSLAR
jgi:hypothetical protein